MKSSPNFFKTILFSFVLIISFSCSNDDNGGPVIVDPEQNIVEIALGTPDLSILVSALQAADGDLVNVLSGDGPFTVLAPTNAAFTAFLDSKGFASLEDVPTDILAEILLNHVLGSEVTSSDLVAGGAGYTNTSATGPGENAISLYYNTSDGVVFNGISTVIDADILASNGIIHIVDTVIDIPTVVTFATADPNFTTLVQALTALTPDTDFVSILSRTEGNNTDGINPEFTVFAPTNDAFAQIEVPEEEILTQVLLHHVVSEANITSGDLNNPGDTPATTLEGDAIVITLPGTDPNIADVTDGAGNTGKGIIAVDVQAGNGVIHVLDSVLLPDTTN